MYSRNKTAHGIILHNAPVPRGLPGPRGYCGPMGPAGPDTYIDWSAFPQEHLSPPAVDIQSFIGPPGAKGIRGIAGPEGPFGAVGDFGPRGHPGPTGKIGEDGDVGARGLPGVMGKVGQVGPVGANGKDGPVGPAGQDDPAGVDGKDGAVGPRGVVGDTGPVGLQGPTGQSDKNNYNGPVGPVGEIGHMGRKGPDGVRGQAGPPGIPGAQGLPGPTGKMGLNNCLSSDLQHLFGPHKGECASNQHMLLNTQAGPIDMLFPTEAADGDQIFCQSMGPVGDYRQFNRVTFNANGLPIENPAKPGTASTFGWFQGNIDHEAYTWRFNQPMNAWQLTSDASVYDGPTGSVGPTGQSGAVGQPGPKGEDGVAGPMGPMGPVTKICHRLIVDSQYGNDSTAQAETLLYPFASCQAAMAQAGSGDVIEVRSGVYSVEKLHKSGIKWYLQHGTTLINKSKWPLFMGTGIVISGHGNIISSNAACIYAHGNDEILVKCNNICSENTSSVIIDSDAQINLYVKNQILCKGPSPAVLVRGFLKIKARRIYSHRDATLVNLAGYVYAQIDECQCDSAAYPCIYQAGGVMNIEIAQINAASAIRIDGTTKTIHQAKVNSIVIEAGPESAGLRVYGDKAKVNLCCQSMAVAPTAATKLLVQNGGLVYIKLGRANLQNTEAEYLNKGLIVQKGILHAEINQLLVEKNAVVSLAQAQIIAQLQYVNCLAGPAVILKSTGSNHLHIGTMRHADNAYAVMVDSADETVNQHLNINSISNTLARGIILQNGVLHCTINDLQSKIGLQAVGGRLLARVNNYTSNVSNHKLLIVSDAHVYLQATNIKCLGSESNISCYIYDSAQCHIEMVDVTAHGLLAEIRDQAYSNWLINSLNCNEGFNIDNAKCYIQVNTAESNSTLCELNSGQLNIEALQLRSHGRSVINVSANGHLTLNSQSTIGETYALLARGTEATYHLYGLLQGNGGAAIKIEKPVNYIRTTDVILRSAGTVAISNSDGQVNIQNMGFMTVNAMLGNNINLLFPANMQMDLQN